MARICWNRWMGKVTWIWPCKQFSMPQGIPLVGPMATYTIPIFISIGKINGNGTSSAKMVIQSIWHWSDGDIYGERTYTTDTYDPSPVLQCFYKGRDTNATIQRDWWKGLRRRGQGRKCRRTRSDAAYFKTAQGKADVERMQKLQQELGGNISNQDPKSKQLAAQELVKRSQQDLQNYISRISSVPAGSWKNGDAESVKWGSGRRRTYGQHATIQCIEYRWKFLCLRQHSSQNNKGVNYRRRTPCPNQNQSCQRVSTPAPLPV